MIIEYDVPRGFFSCLRTFEYDVVLFLWSFGSNIWSFIRRNDCQLNQLGLLNILKSFYQLLRVPLVFSSTSNAKFKLLLYSIFYIFLMRV